MDGKRKIEIFSAGCPVCLDMVEMIQQLACPSCDVKVLNINQPMVAKKAKKLGIRSVPAVLINGKLADCCEGRGPDKEVLMAAGLGQPLT